VYLREEISKEKLVKVKKINEFAADRKIQFHLRATRNREQARQSVKLLTEAVIRVSSGPCDHR
jgi:hypothetical protein